MCCGVNIKLWNIITYPRSGQITTEHRDKITYPRRTLKLIIVVKRSVVIDLTLSTMCLFYGIAWFTCINKKIRVKNFDSS